MAIYQLLLSLSLLPPPARDNRSLQRLTETIDWLGTGITHTARSTPNTLDHSISIKTVAAMSFLLDLTHPATLELRKNSNRFIMFRRKKHLLTIRSWKVRYGEGAVSPWHLEQRIWFIFLLAQHYIRDRDRGGIAGLWRLIGLKTWLVFPAYLTLFQECKRFLWK